MSSLSAGSRSRSTNAAFRFGGKADASRCQNTRLVSGAVDLIPKLGPNAKRTLIDFKSDQSTEISLRAHVSFETASGPYLSEGEDASWIKKRYSQNLERAKRYEPLARNVHLGVGKLSFPGHLPTAIELDIFQVA